MRIYDYLCRRCSHREERYVRRPEEPQKCECGADMVKLPPATKTTFRFADKRK
jgi:hypothetical protein